MAKRTWTSIWAKGMSRGMAALKRAARRTTTMAKPAARMRSTRPVQAPVAAPPSPAQSLTGVARITSGARRYTVYCPPGVAHGDVLPMVVMLHGCRQDATSFAASTRMNAVAARERFVVLYPEQDRLANAQGCWNWFDTMSGRADAEVALIMAAIAQVCTQQPVDAARVAIAGMSAGASMAALVATRHPECFQAVVMHSGVAPGVAHSTLSALGAMRGRRAAKPLPARAAVAGVAAPWPPLLVIQGGVDTVVAARNGTVAAQVWADAAGAQAGVARRVHRGKRHPMTVTDFKRQGRTVATLAMVGRLGHAWSGGAASVPFSDAHGPDASRMVWAFAARQFGRATG